MTTNFSNCLVVLSVITVMSTGLEIDHWGTQFVLSFLKCATSSHTCSNMIVVTARENTEVVIEFPESGLTWQFTLQSTEFKEIDVGPEATAQPYGKRLVNKAVMIEASRPISVYGFSNTTGFSDGFLALPVPGLGVEYLVVNIDDTASGNRQSGPQIVIAVVWDETKVTVEFYRRNICFSASGTAEKFEAGATIVRTMQARDVYNIYCEEQTTGTLIKASKPVAIFTGSANVSIPENGTADFVVEMLPSMADLGTKFVFKAPTGYDGDSFIRVVATPVLTVLKISSGSRSFTIEPREYVDLTLKQGGTMCLTSDHPVLVVYFLRGVVSTSTSATGDGYMSLVPPVTKYTNDYIVHAGALWNFNNYIYLISTESKMTKVLGLFTDNKKVEIPECWDYKVAVIDGYGWIRRFNNTEFILWIYGVKSDEGYGYPGGMKLTHYSGKDNCAESLCQNGGWCLDDFQTYRCRCSPNFTGEHCEQATSETKIMETTIVNKETISENGGSTEQPMLNNNYVDYTTETYGIGNVGSDMMSTTDPLQKASLGDSTSHDNASTTTSQDETTIRKDKTTTVQDKTTVRQDETTVRQDERTTRQDEANTVQDKTTMRQDETTTRKDKTTVMEAGIDGGNKMMTTPIDMINGNGITTALLGASKSTSLSIGASVSNNSAGLGDFNCLCACSLNSRSVNESEVSELVERQKEFLKLEKSQLSKTIRTKQSSENLIQSEKNLGLSAVLLVTFIILGIVAMDLSRVYEWIREKQMIFIHHNLSSNP